MSNTPVTVTPPHAEIPRDRYGRPMVAPAEKGKPEPYTRCTTFVSCLEDTFALQKWMQRMVALGLADRKDLLLSVAAHREDKRQLDKLCDDAREYAKATAAATTGTALHSLTEQMDRGRDIGVVPDEYLADLAAYQAATDPLTAVHIEQFSVLDTYKVGGTPDRVVQYQGKRYIADVKTGDITYGIGKIAMQLAVYARSKTYDHRTRTRGQHGAELDRGLIIHLPAGQGTCSLFWVDLLAGWEGVKLASRVRDWRTRKFDSLTQVFGAQPEPPAPVDEPPRLEQAIDECLTTQALGELWETRWQEFTDEHIRRAAARKGQLQNGEGATA